MTAAARIKAERCFALARSTTFEAERETAVERGIAILQAAGLSLDQFDIPGRDHAIDAAAAAGMTLEEVTRFFAESAERTIRERQRYEEAVRLAKAASDAVNSLWARGWIIYERDAGTISAVRTWFVVKPDGTSDEQATDEQVREWAGLSE